MPKKASPKAQPVSGAPPVTKPQLFIEEISQVRFASKRRRGRYFWLAEIGPGIYELRTVRE